MRFFVIISDLILKLSPPETAGALVVCVTVITVGNWTAFYLILFYVNACGY